MNEATPLISAVIPTYNQAHFLREALVSIRSQTYSQWEAIVVNNYSDDNTIEVVKSFRDPRIHLINFSNHGIIAASRNVGIKRARGEYIAFLDSDDLWKPEKLERCMKRLSKGYDIVCHGVLECWTDGRVRTTFYGPEERAHYDSLLYSGNCFNTSATVVQKKFLKKAGGFDENPAFISAEDYDLWLRLSENDPRVSFIREKLGIYRIHGNNVSGSDQRYFQAECAVITSHFEKQRRYSRLNFHKAKKRYAMAYLGIGRKYVEMGKSVDALTYYIRAMLKFPLFRDPYVLFLLGVLSAFRKSSSAEK